MSSWSYTQKAVLAVIPKITSILSLLGSGWIIIEVLTDTSGPRPKRQHPYHRLLFAMSVYDVLESIWNFASTWAIPKGTNGVVWALGTTATCSAQGFFLTLSVAVPIYNALLSLYYVLVINYRYSDDALKRWVEPAMHAVAGGWAFFTALYSAFSGLLNNANLWCWIAPLPQGCKDSRRYGEEANCVRGDNWWIYRWAFYFAPLWACIFMATVCTFIVYRFVRKMDQKTIKYRKPERMTFFHSQSVKPKRDDSNDDKNEENDDNRSTVSFIVPGSTAALSTTPKASNADGNKCDEKEDTEQCTDSTHATARTDMSSDLPTAASTITRKKSRHLFMSNLAPDRDAMATETYPYILSKSSDQANAQSLDDSQSYGEGDDVIGDLPQSALRVSSASPEDIQRWTLSNSKNTGTSVQQLVSEWKSSREQRREDNKRTVEVFHQACFYLGIFYLTHVWSTTNRILQLVNNGSSNYGVTVIHAIFDPLQGFLNYFVYQRPRYLKIRKKYPEIGQLRALHRMLRFSYQQEPESWMEMHKVYRQRHPSFQSTSSRLSFNDQSSCSAGGGPKD
ncbi:hypothetical protein IV203_020836 [Nitzschia inconspicua]|uniref:G-protein coupled receptors family 2 profile 2 domain-containing protein n=1 Tax=Nitzschia inconspicua TaxID=303405 RepID=A0A9K3KGH3_9STRA|nr:hypothetical protein IV203_020836 [Nitzschia inconspicua]